MDRDLELVTDMGKDPAARAGSSREAAGAQAPMTEEMILRMRREFIQELRQKQKKRKRRKLALLCILLPVLLVAGGRYLGRYLQAQQEEKLQKELDADVGILPGMSEEEIQDRLNRNVAEGRLNISINPTPEYASGTAPGDIRIENIKGNKYSFTVTVTCIGASSDAGAGEHVGEVVLKTGLIDPGSYVREKKLDVALPKGQYTCVATFDAYKNVPDETTGEDDYRQVGSAGTQILITVKE